MLNTKSEIYTAESRVKDLKNVFRSMFSGLIKGRYLAYRLFIKDIKADYSQSKFGALWDFLEPIVLAFIFIMLRRGNVISSGDILIPYSVFIIYGLLSWQTFAESVKLPLSVLQSSKTLLNQVKIPPESLLVSVFLKVAFNAAFRIVVMLVLSFFMNALSWLGFALFLLLFPAIILVGMAAGLLLSPFNVIYNDVGKLVNVTLRPLMYASPVLWAVSPISILGVFNAYNPIGIVISNLRSLATQGIFVDLAPFVITTGVSLLVFCFSWFIFHLSIPILSHKI